MMALRNIRSLLTFCAVLAFASLAPLAYASSGTAIYTTEEAQKVDQKTSKEVKSAPGNSLVAGGMKRTPPAAPAPLFSISLEPKGKATVSQSYTSPVVTTYYAHWTQSGGNVVVTFSPEDRKRQITFSRSGGKLVAKEWAASEWGGKPAPSMHRDNSDAQTAAASSGHHLSFHL
ncbi:MAG TPA: hypothetical protein VM554_11535 [Acidisarcina sp.]|nr:hypothetical protein [Acidisarcina sp.]